MRILLAGATGAIGKRLVPLLIDAGHDVVGTTRSRSKADTLRVSGVEPAIVDVFDARELSRMMLSIRPELVIHQLSDLPPGLDAARMAEGIRHNARMRKVGTQNLVAAAVDSGAHRLIAHSIAWGYAPGPEPHSEDDPLDIFAQGTRAITVEGVAILEQLTLSSPPLEGVVLRYGHLYGPGTGADAASQAPTLHVDAAAAAALLAIDHARPGIYNIAEPSNYLSTDKARSELAWDANFRVGMRVAARIGPEC